MESRNDCFHWHSPADSMIVDGMGHRVEGVSRTPPGTSSPRRLSLLERLAQHPNWIVMLSASSPPHPAAAVMKCTSRRDDRGARQRLSRLGEEITRLLCGRRCEVARSLKPHQPWRHRNSLGRPRQDGLDRSSP